MAVRAGKLTRGERNAAWIEAHCMVPEGKGIGQPVRLRPFQRDIMRGIYDTPTRRAVISFGRKNGKTALSAFLLLLHLCGPEARQNSQLYSAAQSRDQAAILFDLAMKVVRQSPDLLAVIQVRDTRKELLCPELGTRYRALSAEAATAYGLSPAFVVHDELGQVEDETSPLYEAIETAAGAQDEPLSIVISTQAPDDSHLLSRLIEDAKGDPSGQQKLFLFTAPLDMDPFSDEAIKAANPAWGDFLNADGVGNSPVSIVDRAEVPGGPFKPNLFFNLLAGLGAGLLVGVGLAFALEFLNDVIRTREDVRMRLNQACLGVVPRRDGKGSVLQDIEDPTSHVAEAYSAILAALRFSTDHGAPRSLLVTSSAPAEGKSSSAFAMAQNYARRGERVLLIDSDLRRPVFKAHSSRQGLTKLLTNDEPLRAHLLDTQYENLWLLPCGPTPPNPADLLSTSRFAAILREAEGEFDRVIIDGPPLLGLADAPLLATAAQHVVMVVEAGRTRTKAARQSIDQIRAAGAHILGVVLTKSTEEASTYGYRLYRYSAVEDRRDDLIMISAGKNEE